MAIPFLSNIDLNRNQALQLVLHNKTSDPSPAVQGQVYWNSDENKAYVYNGGAWINIGGDITGVNITAGAGLTGSQNTTVGQHTQTIDVIGGDGITANADEIEVTVDDSTLELSATNGSGAVRIKDSGVATDKIADEAVTLAKIQHIASQKILGRNTSGTGDVESLSPSDFRPFLKTALGAGFGSNAVSIGDSTDTVTIPGNLKVTGDTTYSNETIQIVTDNTLAFRAGDGNDHEILLTAADATSDKTITLPNLTGHAALLDVAATETITSTPAELNILDGATVTTAELNIIDGNTSATSTSLVDADRVVVNDAGTMKQVAFSDVATYIEAQITARELTVQLAASESAVTKSGNVYTVTHSFGTRNVLCQVIENNISGSLNGTYQTVVVDVDRPSDTTVEVDFGQSVTDGHYRILIHKIG
jgi:hypothetical protein